MKKIISVLNGHTKHPSPLWLMRQAGRYLPEYRQMREQAGSFLNLVYNPEYAAEVTLQPIRRFGFDAAILFSDILVVPQALGVHLAFETGEGPVLSPTRTLDDIKKQTPERAMEMLAPIFETVRLIKSGLAKEGYIDTALIGFAGSPWTILCYMVQGNAHDHDFKTVIDAAQKNPEFFDSLCDQVTDTTISYLAGQIDAGAEIIQLFDSWAGVLKDDDLFDQYVINPTVKIVTALREKYPHIPVIGFPRGTDMHKAIYYARIYKVQGMSCDQHMNMATLRNILDGRVVLQGNLDPAILLDGGDAMKREIDNLMRIMAGYPYIFNLGHGITPDVPPEHVEQLVEYVRGYRA